MIRCSRAILLFCILSAICSFSLSGCTNIKNEIDKFTLSDNAVKRNAISLKNHDCEMELTTNVESVQIMQDYIFTNTKQISVSSSDIMNATEISLFLYNSQSSDPIGYATLKYEEQEAIFSNLSSSEVYKIGATIKNSPDPVKIIITD